MEVAASDDVDAQSSSTLSAAWSPGLVWGEPGSATLSITGGVAPYQLTGLPSGLTYEGSTSDIIISGVPY